MIRRRQGGVHLKTSSRVALLATFLGVGLVLGCGSTQPNRGSSEWMRTVNSIKPGTTMDKVRSRLGPPDTRVEGEAPVRPAPPIGSPRGVLVTLAAETRYEQWTYQRGDSRFYVFFAKAHTDPRAWEVIAVRSAPVTAVD
jgi:hypothetical protein